MHLKKFYTILLRDYEMDDVMTLDLISAYTIADAPWSKTFQSHFIISTCFRPKGLLQFSLFYHEKQLRQNLLLYR